MSAHSNRPLEQKLAEARTEAEAVEQRVRARATTRRMAISVPPPATVPFERDPVVTLHRGDAVPENLAFPSDDVPTRKLPRVPASPAIEQRAADAKSAETTYSIVLGRNKAR